MGAAKLRAPTPHTNLLSRPRLIDILNEALSGKMTVITAPGGYGKTSLLTDFTSGLDIPICWYTIGASDAHPGLFLQNLARALQEQFPSFGQTFMEEAKAKGRDIAEADNLAKVFLEELAFEAPEPFVVVLDDLHNVDGHPETWKLLDTLLAGLTDHCHVILAGRIWPKLSTLPLMLARQQVTKLDASQLAFTEEELGRFFAEVLERPASGEIVRKALEVTEGWPGAIILLAEDGLTETPEVSFSGLIADFLEAEIWSMQSAEVREFMQKTSILRQLRPAFCNQLLGITDAQQVLAGLARDSLAILQDGDEGYRYHRLVRGFLLARLRTEAPTELTELHRKAAVAYEREAMPGEAIYHYVESGSWDEVGRILNETSEDLLKQGRWPELLQWLDAIPDNVMEILPRALLLRAKVLYQMNQIDPALQDIYRASPLLMAGNDCPSVAEALITQASCLRLKGDYPAAIETCNKACAILVQEGGSVTVLTEARKELGITYAMAGQLDRAIQELKGALDMYEAKGDSANIAHVSDQIGSSLMLMGRLPEAASYLETAYQRWHRLGNELRQVQTLNNLGVLYFLQGDYDRADEALREALQKSEENAYTRYKAYILASIADLERQRGQLKTALELYRRCLDLSHEIEETSLAIYATDGMANVHRLTGELAKAETLVQHAIAAAEDRGGTLDMGICQTTLGLIYMDKGEPKEALKHLERAIELLSEGDAKRELTKAHFHLAEANYRLHKKTAAAENLKRVAVLAQELGHYHFLAAPAMAAPYLVQYAVALKIGDGFYGRLAHLLKEANAGESEEDEAAERSALPSVDAYGLGGARVVIDGREVTDLEWRSEKSKEMFFYFITLGRPLSKDEVVAALWPDLPEEKCNSAFHSNLYRLRQALYNECIAKDGGRYSLNQQGRFSYDVSDFQTFVRDSEAADGTDKAIEAAEKALVLYNGEYATNFYSDWAEALRWQLAEQHLRLASNLAALYLEKGEYTRASELYHRILEQDEYNEAAWYRLMRAYVEAGQVEAAKYCYQRYSDLLQHLGEAPSIDFSTLFKSITGRKA